MLTKVIYNCEIINSGNYVTSADIFMPKGQKLLTSRLSFSSNNTTIPVSAIVEKDNQLHVDFKVASGLAILKFDAKKFVNEYDYPQIVLTVDGESPLQYEVEFKEDPYLKDFDSHIFQQGAGRISYYQYEKGSAKSSRPLVIFLHGSGERGFNNRMPLLGNDVPKTIHDFIHQNEDAVLLVPQASWSTELNGWFRPEIRATLLSLIKAKIEQENIDVTRVYLLGLSNGGAATWHFAENYPELFTAIVPCCGYIYNENKKFVQTAAQGRYMQPEKTEAQALKHMPIWAFHAHDDHTVNVQGTIETTQMVKDYGNQNVNVTIYDDGQVAPNPHASWELAFDTPELLPWLFAQKKA